MPRSTAAMPKGGEVVPQRTTTARCSPASTAQSPAVALPPQGVGAPLLGRRCRLALLPGGCFIHPSRAARTVSASGPRLFPGCLERHSSRSCAARFQPAFALQPQSCDALPAPKPRFQSKLRRDPSRVNLDSTSKLYRAVPSPGQAFPGTAGREKNARNETNRIEPAAPRAGPAGGLPRPRLCCGV